MDKGRLFSGLITLFYTVEVRLLGDVPIPEDNEGNNAVPSKLV